MHALSYRRALLLTAAVALSLATAMIVRAWVDEARHLALQASSDDVVKPSMKRVLVAARALPSGGFIKSEDLQWQEWPSDTMNNVYIVEGARPMDDIVGSVVRQGIAQGEPITEDRLIHKGDHGFLSAVMTPGMRAVTLQLPQNAGLGGLVVPGDHVDVLLTADIPAAGGNGGAQGQNEHRATETVLEDIRVIAIDQKISDMSNENEMAHTATLEVTAKQAEILALVTDMGKLSLTLRSLAENEQKPDLLNGDGEPAKPSVTWDNEATDLGLSPHSIAPQNSSSDTVDLVRGSDKKSIDFPREGK